MENWIMSIMEQFGYMGILFLIALENIFPPIPSEVILTFGGFMTTYTKLTVTGVVIFSTIGSVVGAIILYGIGKMMDIPKIEKIIKRWGHILRITNDDIHRVNRWFERYGVWTVFFCRFIPLIRSLISIPAGMTHMNFWLFLTLTTVGTFLWNIVLISIGAMVGDSWETIVYYMDTYSNVVYVMIGLVLICTLYLIVKRKKVQQK